MAKFTGDRGLNVFIDPDEASQVSDVAGSPGKSTVAMKNGSVIVLHGLYASDVMRHLENEAR